MRRTMMILAFAAMGGLAAAGLNAAEPVKTQPTELMKTDLTGDANREVRLVNVIIPPGADSGRHWHHGDQYTTVQEGEIHITVDGKGDHVYKAGEVVHIDPKVIHRTQNLSDKPARTLEVFIVDKGQPIVEKVQ